VPELLAHAHCYALGNAQNVAVSERNGPAGYTELARRLG